ncbi:MAG: acyl-CoA synthetase [Sphingomonas sp. SCN 67-18]|uniref:acyl-CoA synthetase n=1 Tax=uncultured Sphingomonas sp. TaxID=158754 RepID=UPI00086D52B3|nr:acyl-CoA synthetase [Sphingomonas sp. SCN 67-18]ODU22067.1 MAG: acyl-CoA synthetase [Sphingomonas sp. SCN 67-18]
MHPSHHARTTPDKAAIIVAETGETVSYAQLDAASNRAAHLFRAAGLKAGDTVALFMENSPQFLEIAWGAQRAGLYFVCVSSKLTAAEVDYILADSGARMLVTCPALAGVAGALCAPVARYTLGPAAAPFRSWTDEAAALPSSPIADESAGTDMLYSSGTTGRPKGIRLALPDPPVIDAPNGLTVLAQMLYGFGPDSIYLSPAPLYHAAPLRWTMTAQRLGGTVVIMTHFDPEAALAAIARHRVTHSQWVPTHFVRMLKLPEDARAAHDLSSLKVAIHAAAPCPVPVKRAMIAWWGPVIFEYYAGSEGNGLTAINSADWLAHEGSVGRAVHGIAHICDEAGDELPPGAEGLVYFESPGQFQYHNDPAKTAESRNRHGWTTLGDVGRMDAEGYLYLTDRKSFMIISGGVNIYPQEIENLIITHPAVADVAVIGAPHDEMGEQVVAVVQPVAMADAGDALAAEISAFCRAGLSAVKLPRRIDFVAQLPRHATGKLYKRLLRDRYWGKGETTIV